MIEYGFSPEHQRIASDVALGIMVYAMCYSSEQRAAIRRRDGQRCQMDCDKATHCNPQAPLEIHHLIPQAYARQFGIDPDFPENGISLCRDFHQKELHGISVPSAQAAIRERRVFWNEKFDRMLKAIAIRNTQRATARGWIFPEKPKNRS